MPQPCFQRLAWSGALCLAAISCSSEPAGTLSGDQPVEYSVAINAVTFADLPRCTTASNGSVAHVDRPSSLWSCAFGRWREIPWTPEPAGTNCAEGGVRIDSGVDDNADGVLDLLEIDNSAYVCNGRAPAECGDGSVDPGEECDDGNTESGDGCSLICRVEPAACTPGTTQCDGPGIQTCQGDETWGPTEACPGSQSCLLGTCMTN